MQLLSPPLQTTPGISAGVQVNSSCALGDGDQHCAQGQDNGWWELSTTPGTAYALTQA